MNVPPPIAERGDNRDERSDERGWDVRLGEAVAVANIPTLLMVLVQLTGDRRWLADPFRPRREGGMGDNDSGGLVPDLQAEVRAAARSAISAWHRGQPAVIAEPAPELLVEMLSCAMGESVPPEYGPMTGAQLGLDRFVDPVRTLDPPAGFRVLVIGAGASGLCAGVNLGRAGIEYTIVEKHDTVGGVWLENRYPGAGVDTPNHLYSFSFAPYDWSQFFALRDELHGYLEHVADEFAVRPHIRFGTEVQRVAYDGDTRRWSVEVRGPDGAAATLVADVVLSSVGIFNPLKMPDIPGLDRFEGPAFHTARWPADADLAGKRVAIIGNGASAMPRSRS